MSSITMLRALLLVIACTSAMARADTCQIHEDRAARTAQRMLQAMIEVNGVPGMGAAVWRGDRLVWTGCAGWRDRDAGLPVEADTIFRLASVSKLFAATAVARLAEQERLDLDAPVADLLPWLGTRWAPISLRQLAAHASGLGHYIEADQALGQRRFANARAAVRWFFDRPLGAPPGSRYTYSSWGYTLIGAAIEATTGTRYIDYIQSDIAPGLQVAQDSSGIGARVSRLYSIDGAEPVQLVGNDMSYTIPGGGMTSSPASLVEFAGRLMDGRIVSPDTFAAMLRPYVLDNGMPAGEGDYRVGLGWRTSSDADGAAIAHHAGIADGGRAALVLWPKERSAVGLMSNAIWVSSIETSAMLLAAPFRAEPQGLVPRICPLNERRYRGSLGDVPVEGELRFRLEAGRCVGVLEPDANFQAAFAKARAWPQRHLQVVGLSATGDLSRAALATPFGLYELRADAGGWYARLPSGMLRLKVQPAL